MAILFTNDSVMVVKFTNDSLMAAVFIIVYNYYGYDCAAKSVIFPSSLVPLHY